MAVKVDFRTFKWKDRHPSSPLQARASHPPPGACEVCPLTKPHCRRGPVAFEPPAGPDLNLALSYFKYF